MDRDRSALRDGGIVPPAVEKAEPEGGGKGRGRARTDAGAAPTDGERPPGQRASEFAGEELVVRYPSADEPVVDGESIRLAPGEVTALVGPNGSGKSTLLKGLARQVEPEEGTAYLDGTDVQTLETKALARRLGLLTQENVSPEGITVAELVGHGRYPHQGFLEPRSGADVAAIDRALSLAGVAELRERKLRNLSGGQKQLVWIAMTLAQETDVLLLDEPTTFLDVRHQLKVMDVVETLRDDGDVTIGLVLHDLEQAARYADRLVAVRDGAIQAAGPPEQVVTEDLFAEVFGIDAAVEAGREGPRITPLGPADGGTNGDDDG